VVEIADIALYAAKRGGRDAWVGLSVGEHLAVEGLMHRIRFDPMSTLRNDELRLTSSVPVERIVAALAPLEKP